MTVIAKKNDTLLYLKMEGDQDSTVFVDSSPYGRNITATRAFIDHSESAVGPSCAKIRDESEGAWLEVEGFDYTGDLTIEYFVKFITSELFYGQDYRSIFSNSDISVLFWHRTTGESAHYPGGYVSANVGGKSAFFSYASYNINESMDTWFVSDYDLPEEGFEHHAFVFNYPYITFFKNGKWRGTREALTSPVSLSSANPLFIGTHYQENVRDSYCVNGWVDDFRITAGVRYTEDFTVHTDPFDLDSEEIVNKMAISMSLSYAVIYNSSNWLHPQYIHRWKITVDRTKFFVDRENYYLPLLICSDVGMNRKDLSVIFNSVGSYENRKRIAITLEDGITEIPVKIMAWDHSGQFAWIYAVVPRVNNRDWHKDTSLYFYCSRDSDNPNVEDMS